MDYLDIEIVIGDFLNDADIKNVNRLQIIADIIHQHVEAAISDFALDNSFDDYEATFERR